MRAREMLFCIGWWHAQYGVKNILELVELCVKPSESGCHLKVQMISAKVKSLPWPEVTATATASNGTARQQNNVSDGRGTGFEMAVA